MEKLQLFKDEYLHGIGRINQTLLMHLKYIELKKILR
jgi:hypothetical protein